MVPARSESKRARSPGEKTSGRFRLFGARRSVLALRVRGGRGLCRQGFAVCVEQLNFRRAVQLGDRFAFGLLRDVAGGLILDLLERREGLGANTLDLDDVPPELGLDRLGN